MKGYYQFALIKPPSDIFDGKTAQSYAEIWRKDIEDWRTLPNLKNHRHATQYAEQAARNAFYWDMLAQGARYSVIESLWLQDPVFFP